MAEHIDETKGRIKVAAGELTGNDKLKREGQTDKVRGKVKKAIDEAARNAKRVVSQ
jgi:uncharacterized protein YjbJ (UPF0337 family)